ncbi:hypothetical protein [Cupriavidus oxalaticus]|uniref:hypothetical protein n=1 Tax=Cupriavidus oxalaticus TaxID=96344 RepID=UPI003D65E485
MLVPLDLAQWKHGSLIETLRSKVEDIEALEVRLAQSEAHLVALLAEIEAKPEEIDCATNARSCCRGYDQGNWKAQPWRPAMSLPFARQAGAAGRSGLANGPSMVCATARPKRLACATSQHEFR